MNVICTESTTTLKSPLEAFYSNSTILISGGNGFLGKVLVEKLLRCFNVSKIFLLMRAKNGENVEMRSKKFFHENVSFKDENRVLSLKIFFCCRSLRK